MKNRLSILLFWVKLFNFCLMIRKRLIPIIYYLRNFIRTVVPQIIAIIDIFLICSFLFSVSCLFVKVLIYPLTLLLCKTNFENKICFLQFQLQMSSQNRMGYGDIFISLTDKDPKKRELDELLSLYKQRSTQTICGFFTGRSDTRFCSTSEICSEQIGRSAVHLSPPNRETLFKRLRSNVNLSPKSGKISMASPITYSDEQQDQFHQYFSLNTLRSVKSSPTL